MRANFTRGYSAIAITAALSVAILIAALGSEVGKHMRPRTPMVTTNPQAAVPSAYVPLEDADKNGTPDWQDELIRAGIDISTTTDDVASTTSNDPLFSAADSVAKALFGGYLSLKQYDQYSPSRGEELANNVVSSLRAPQLFVPHAKTELRVVSDTSEKRVLEYRADMREALAPLVTNDPPEFEMYGRYLATKDSYWLDQLLNAAHRYRTASENMLSTEVPSDAADVHLRALNALGTFADTIERLAHFADDSLAAYALLRTYNTNEQEMYSAFDALSKYYVYKVTK